MALGKAGQVFIEVLPDVAKFGSQLQSDIQTPLQSVGQSMTKVGSAMTLGLTVPLAAIGAKAVDAFQESATVAAQTEAAIKSTGGAAGVTAKQIGDLAASVSGYSGIDDEAVQSAENMLLTFTGVRNEVGKGNDIFNRATKSVADLATRMAGGAAPSAEQLQTASVQLGKALNDPIAGLGSLSRVGVKFTAQQRDSIKALVESGDTMSAQKIILGELTKEFGGSAKAFGDSAAGGAAKAKVALGNAMESIGRAIQPVIETVAKIAKAFGDWFSGMPAGAQKIIVVIGGIVAAGGPLLIMLGKVLTIFPQIGTAFKALSAILSANPWAAIIAATIAVVILIVKNWDKIKAAVLAAWNWIKKAAAKVWNAILNFFKRFWPILLGVMTGGIGLVVGLIIKNWGKIKEFTAKVWKSVLAFLKTIPKAILGIFRSAATWLVNAGRWIVTGLWNGLKAIWSTVSGWFREIPGHVRDFFAAAAGWLLSAGRAIISGLWDGLTSFWSSVVSWFRGLPGMIVGAVGNLGSVLLDAGRQVIMGLINGIGSMVGALWDKLKSIVGGLISGAKHLLGIGSPSKVFAGVGRDTMAGMAAGLRDVWDSDVQPLLRQMEPALRGRLRVRASVAGLDDVSRGVAIRGSLTLTPDGRAFVEGVIAQDDRGGRQFAAGLRRMGSAP